MSFSVHPRTRGEDFYGDFGDPFDPRFTPAHAGKTVESLSRCDGPAVHPRTRGEDWDIRASATAPPGSPPHTRGRHSFKMDLRRAGRFTPAHAGKTYGGVDRLSAPAVHPRTRGEDIPRTVGKLYIVGSPPHTRGRPTTGKVDPRMARFTPAHAGKTFNSRSSSAIRSVHPRTRGEDARPRRVG